MATVPVPITWVAGQVVTAAQLNANVRDAINFLLAPPICELRQATAQSMTSGVITPMLWDTEEIDNDNMHSTATNTSRITAVTAGRYWVGGGISFAANATGVRVGLYQVNGTEVAGSEIEIGTAGGFPTSLALRPRQIFLNVGDYLEACGEHTVGAALSTSGSTQSSISVRWVSNV